MILKEACNWSMVDMSVISDKININKLDENNVRNERVILENIAKLSIDYFLDYDYYKKFSLQNNFRGCDYNEKMRKLGFNEVEGFWISERKPDRDTVIENVFISCLYRSIEMKMAMQQQNLCEQNQSDNEFVVNVNDDGDPVDNLAVGGSFESCDDNASKMRNMNRDGITVHNNTVLGSRAGDIGANCVRETYQTIDRNEDCVNSENRNDDVRIKVTPKNDEKMNNSLSMKKSFDILELQTDKWLCKSCQILNPYQSDTCSICSRDRQENGLWICTNCSFINEIHLNNCDVCSVVNELNRRQKIFEVEKRSSLISPTTNPIFTYSKSNIQGAFCSIPIENVSKWQCPNNTCNQFNDNASGICFNCGYIRAPSGTIDTFKEPHNIRNIPLFEDPVVKVNKNLDNLDQGRWSCEKCTYINKSGDRCCGVCKVKNPLGATIPVNEAETPDFWICWHKKCKQMNDFRFDYCQKCGLYRHASRRSGDIVQRRNKFGITDIWVCYSCGKFNNVEDENCDGRNCNKNRFY